MQLDVQQEVIIEFPSLSDARQGGYPYTPKQLRTILRGKLIVIYLYGEQIRHHTLLLLLFVKSKENEL